jgi:electron transport complex protein RnfC
MKRTFHKGGIHPPENKLTESERIINVELPREVVVTFSQHIGAMARCVLKKGDHVKRGDLVAEASGFVSANVHTPISGTVTKLDKSKTAFGFPADTVTIIADADDHAADIEAIASLKPLRDDEVMESLAPAEIIEIVNAAGIVGLGGATFPTKVKLMPPAGSKAEVLIVNGVECEPFLTNDDALMREHPAEIIEGVKLLMRAVGVNRAVIGIEGNKSKAINLLKELTDSEPMIEVVELKVKYPQGGEKQLIEAVTGREVPEGGLPIATGAIVQNVATVFAVYEAVRYGKPLIERVVTVTGPSVAKPGNYRVPIGMNMSALIEIAGGVPADTGKIVLGGPMMGRAIVSVDAPTVKGVSGILMLPEAVSSRGKVMPCIRCASCVSACPMGLEPYLLALLSSHSMWEELEEQKVMNCIECGCCSYTCPSWRPLLDYIRLGKTTVGGIIRARQTKK